MEPPPRDLENPGPCRAHPGLAGNSLLEKFPHEGVDAGIAFRRVHLRLPDQIRGKVERKISAVQFHGKQCITSLWVVANASSPIEERLRRPLRVS